MHALNSLSFQLLSSAFLVIVSKTVACVNSHTAVEVFAISFLAAQPMFNEIVEALILH